MPSHSNQTPDDIQSPVREECSVIITIMKTLRIYSRLWPDSGILIVFGFLPLSEIQLCMWRYSQGKESLAEKKDFLGSWAKCRRWSEDLLVDERQISRLRPGKGWVGDWVSVGWISFGWVAKITKVGLGIFVSNLVVSAHKIFPQLSIPCVGCGCGLWAVAADFLEYVWL